MAWSFPTQTDTGAKECSSCYVFEKFSGIMSEQKVPGHKNSNQHPLICVEHVSKTMLSENLKSQLNFSAFVLIFPQYLSSYHAVRTDL